MNCVIAIRDGHYHYGERAILTGIDLTVEQGEFAAVLGVNGAGKSTLLDLLAGLKHPGQGSVLLNQRDLRQWGAKERAQFVSHLPQGLDRDLPFTAKQLVLMGRYPHTDQWFESAEDEQVIEQAMQQMHCCSSATAPLRH